MRKFLVLLFVVLVGFSVENTRNEFVRLDWSHPFVTVEQGAGYTAILENPGFPVSGPELPVYTRLYEQPDANRSMRFQIDNLSYEEVPGNWTPEQLAELPEEAVINSRLLKSGSSYKNELSVVPLKKENDKVYRLLSFDLKSIPMVVTKSVSAMYDWKSSSVLASGNWIKISTLGRGIYRIPYSKLRTWGFNDPAAVQVFGSGAITIAEDPGKISYDDLKQCAVWRNQNGGEDCLFFYAPGYTTWTLNSNGQFTHANNDYTREGYFFLSESVAAEKTPVTVPVVTSEVTHPTSTFDEYVFIENDLTNLLSLGSGKQWFGEKFIAGNTRSFSIPVSDPLGDATLRVTAAARSYANSSMVTGVNGSEIGTVSFSQVATSDSYGLYADLRNRVFSVEVSGSSVDVSLRYSASNMSAECWLDHLELNYRRHLKVGSTPVFFRDGESVGEGNVVEFTIDNAGSSTLLFDVSDVSEVKKIPTELSNGELVARQLADELREYVVFNPEGNFNEPELVEEIENQNLHGLETPDYVIISHTNFLASAKELADFHRQQNGMKVEVVDVAKIYNEFSSGSADASGIRNFIKMLYDRGSNLKYVLLFGDGSYDNRWIKSGTKNFVPTYQSANSLTPTSSFVTDDYFVLLDAGESVYNGAIDLGIGRLPVNTAYEAQYVIDKIKRYQEPSALGNWRNRITFIGDDEDGGLHMRQSEELADSVNENNKAFVVDKIYFDAYVQQVTPSGEAYPEVNTAINERVKDGVLILNYIGHANDRFLAHERVLDISDINAWSNAATMPIFVTATCEFSRFDSEETSAGEYVLLNPNGGGIGLFSTTRVVYASANFKLSKSFYSYIFKNDQNGEHYRMGDVMRLAKTNIGSSINKRNFSLLADPALRLSFPKYRVITRTINGKDASTYRETIGALEEVTIEGYIGDAFGNKVDGFNGTLIPTVYDKEQVMQTLGNAGETPINFKVRENVIYKGESSVTNGEFSFTFVVPRDISYSLGEGKMVFYADDGQEDAHGAFENFDIGGPGSEITDNEGPDVELFMDSPNFKSGSTTGKNPILIAYLSDENGINTVGTGIGHDITAVIDDNYSNVFVLNSYYKANADDHTSGIINYPLRDLSVGRHTLRLKAWDVANNSSEQEIEFEVTGDFVIREVTNYPNPLTDYTYFVIKHNQASASLDVIFDIYNSEGRSIDRFQTTVGSNGGITNPVRWDLSELSIAATPGIYIYRVLVQNSEGLITSKSGKMIVRQ